MSTRRVSLRLPWWSVAACIAMHTSVLRAMSCPTRHADTTAASQWAPSLDRIVTAHANDISLRDALDRLAASAKLRISYSADLLPLSRAVCLSADEESVGSVLATLLAETSVMTPMERMPRRRICA